MEFAATGWTAVANATGWAAITLPLGEVDGLPVGVQLIAPDEVILLRVAAQLEAAMPWSDRRPARLRLSCSLAPDAASDLLVLLLFLCFLCFFFGPRGT